MTVESKFVGKTISSIDTECINVITLYFTDGTKVAIYADCGSNKYDLPFIEIES